MKKKTGRYVTISIVVVILAGCGLWFFRDLSAAKTPMYMTVPVTRRDIQETVPATGVLMASKLVDVGAQVSGQIESLKVSLGDQVKKGQLLAVIDPSVAENDLKNAAAQLKSVAAQKLAKEALLKEYELGYKRQQEMRQSDASARADLESAKANLDSTKADIEALDAQITQAKISISTAQTNLSYTRIVAPMDGEVVAVEKEEGQTLVSKQEAPVLLILADVDTMTVKAEISEADVMRVKPGMPVYFTVLGAPDRRYSGTLRSVDPAPESVTNSDISAKTISASATYYNGQFNVANPDRKLRIFMTAQVSIVLGQAKQSLSIPLSVLGQDEGRDRYQVQVLANGKPESRVIKTGLKDNVYVQVLDGLSEGDRVVVGDSKTAAAATASENQTRFRGPLGGHV